MKKNINLIIISICLVVTGCICKKEVLRPDRSTIMKLKATFSDTNFILKFKDTLFIESIIPDSVTISTTTGDTLVKVNSITKTYTLIDYGPLDTTVSPVRRSILDNAFALEGKIEPVRLFYYRTNIKPFKFKIGLPLNNKGYYLISIASHLGEFDINGDFKGSVAVDFDVKNKHIDKVRGVVKDDAWADDAINRGIAKGLGTYAFKVE